MSNKANPRTPVLVLDLFTTGLSLLRLFAKRGIPVYGIDPEESRIGFASRYGIKRVSPHPVTDSEACVAFIKDLVQEAGEKMVAIPTSDSFALLLDSHREELSQYLYFAMPEYSLEEKIVSKNGLFKLAEEFSVPVPATCFVEDASGMAEAVTKVRYPAIIKPVFSFEWHRGPVQETTQGKKVLLVNSAEEALDYYSKLLPYSPHVVLQEIIEGPDSNLVYFVSYTNRKHRVTTSFAGRKNRVSPIHFGSASHASSLRDPEFRSLCVRLLEGIKFWGCSGVEMKKDSRDNCYKLVEINARYGLWDALGSRYGVDTAYAAYCDLLGLPYEEAHDIPDGVKWVRFSEDIRNFVRYRREGEVTLSEWISSLCGKVFWDDISLLDPLPTLKTLANIPLGALRTLFRMLRP